MKIRHIYELECDRETAYKKKRERVCLEPACGPLKTHFHTMAFSLALYLAFPFMQITCTPLVFNGVGILT